MRSNTKLTTNQKDTLTSLKGSNMGVTLVNNEQTTIAYKELGNTVEFSLSVMSDNEKKFRRKVGEFHALMRFYVSQTVSMGYADFHTMMRCVFGLYL